MPRTPLTAGMGNAERLRVLRADAVSRGLCLECRCRFPRPGIRICDTCLDRRDQREAANRARGKCGCGRARYGRFALCTRCRAESRRKNAARYQFAKLSGSCTRNGCHLPSVTGHIRCFKHLDEMANDARARRASGLGRPVASRSCSVCGEAGHNKRRHERVGLLP